MKSEITLQSHSPADRMLEWRRQAEAAYDAQEVEARPGDPTAFYLRRLEVVTSLLAEVMSHLSTLYPRIALGGRDLMAYIDVCLSRVSVSGSRMSADERWCALWESWRAGVAGVHPWEGDSSTAAQMARILFVSIGILRRLYEFPSVGELLGVERGFEIYAQILPFPIHADIPLSQQACIIAENLHWLHERLGDSTE